MRANTYRICWGLGWVLLTACETVIPVADGMGMEVETDTSSEVDSGIEIPGIKGGDLVHRWRFDDDLNDEIGESDAVIVTPADAEGGNAYLSEGAVYLTGGNPSEAEWISLGTNLLNEHEGGAVSIELFATQWSINFFSRIFEFGASGIEQVLMTWSYENDAESDLVRWYDESKVPVLDTNAPYTLEQEYHIAMVIDPGGGTDGTMRITWYTAPSDAADISAAGFLETSDPLTRMRDIDCWLGKSHVESDPVANASYADVRIWLGALTETDIAELHRRGPDM